MDDIIKLIGTIGFPAAVTIFVLVRLEARLRELTHAVELLHRCLTRWSADQADGREA